MNTKYTVENQTGDLHASRKYPSYWVGTAELDDRWITWSRTLAEIVALKMGGVVVKL